MSRVLSRASIGSLISLPRLSESPKDLSICKIVVNFLILAIPTVISCAFMMLTNLVNALYAGKMNDPAKLAAVGLANSWLNVISFSIFTGTNAAQETLAS